MGPRFVISKPTTVNDVGSPSENIVSDVHRIVALIQDERHMIAEELLASVKQRMADYEKEIAAATSKSSSSSSSSKFKLRRSASSKTRQDRSKDMEEVRQLFKKHGAMLVKLQVKKKKNTKKRNHREDYQVTLAPRFYTKTQEKGEKMSHFPLFGTLLKISHACPLCCIEPCSFYCFGGRWMDLPLFFWSLSPFVESLVFGCFLLLVVSDGSPFLIRIVVISFVWRKRI
jgi:hypothetical protein